MKFNKLISVVSISIGVIGVFISLLSFFNESLLSQKTNGDNSPAIINKGGSINIGVNNSAVNMNINQEILKKKPKLIIKKVLGNNIKIISTNIIKKEDDYDYILILYRKNSFIYLSSIKFLENSWEESWKKKFDVTFRSPIIGLSEDKKFYISSGCEYGLCSNRGILYYSIKNDFSYDFFMVDDNLRIGGNFKKDEADSQDVYRNLQRYIYNFPFTSDYSIESIAIAEFPLNKIQSILSFNDYIDNKKKLYKNSIDSYEKTIKHERIVFDTLKKIIKPSKELVYPFLVIANFDNDIELEYLVVYRNTKKTTEYEFDRFGTLCNHDFFIIDDNFVQQLPTYENTYCQKGGDIEYGNKFYPLIYLSEKNVKYISLSQNINPNIENPYSHVFYKKNGKYTVLKNTEIEQKIEEDSHRLLNKYLY